MTPLPATPCKRYSRFGLKKVRAMVAILSIILIILPACYLAWLHYHSQQLWQIVSQHCVPNQQQHGSPAPCLRVNLTQHYVVFNDAHGPLHTLLIPQEKISGIESTALLSGEAESFFQSAWENRYLLQQQAAFPILDRYLALAINSRYGRTQNQLHIHLACLKPEVYQAIQRQQKRIDHHWQELETPLSGQRYLAIKVAATTNPFIALDHYVQAQGDRMKNYGLVRLLADNGEAILLTSRMQLMELTLGTVETLLDVDCKLAQTSG